LARVPLAVIQLAVAAFEEHGPSVLGEDLDPAAAKDAQAFVAQVLPQVHALRRGMRALEDRVMEQGATAGVFAFEVYRRLRALSLLPSGAALLPQADAMQAKMKRPRRKKPVATEAQAPAPKEAAIDPKPAS
jgi:hypothetical protein